MSEGTRDRNLRTTPRDKTGGVVNSRRTPRRRTRLHTGRVFDTALHFLAEVTIHDVSEKGARIRLQRSVPLPVSIVVADETEGRVAQAHVRWRRHDEAGLAIAEWRSRADLDAQAASRLFGGCYAAEE